MVPVSARLRQGGAIALLPAATFVVHQLRYLLAFGPHAGRELTEQGHSYLTSLTPWIVVLCGLAFGGLLARLARARSGHAPGATSLRFAGLWAVAAGGLVALYGLQESLEGLFATGHPGGIAAIVGDGGWWAVPAAIAVGLVLALLLRGADRLVEMVGRRHRAAPTPARAPAPVRICAFVGIRPLAPLAAGGAGRAPPA